MTRSVSRLLRCMFAVSVAVCAGCAGNADSAADAPAQDGVAARGAGQGAYAAVARGRIDVEGGPLKLAMPVEGTLRQVAVREGDEVKRGQTLAVLDATAARAENEIAAARLDQARAQESLLRQRLQQARTRARRLAEAAAAGAGDGQSADDARDAQAQLQAELDNAAAATRIAAAQREQTAFALDRHTLKAPIDAEVARVSAQPGMSVSARDGVLFTLLPRQPRIVRAELNAAYLDAVRPGMRAQVIDDSDSQRVLGGARVLRLAQSFGPSTQEDDPEVRANERTVECVLAFDRPNNLRLGQRVLVRFLGAAP